MSFHISNAHGVNFQQHGLVQPGGNFLVSQDLAVQLLQLSSLCSIGALASHDEAAVTEEGITGSANTLNTGEGAILDGSVVECTGDGHATLLIGFQNLGLVGNGEVGLALGNSLSSLSSGLVGSQLQLVASAHGAEQCGSQECLGTGSAVNSDGNGVAGSDISFQVSDALDVQSCISGQNENRGVQVLNEHEVLVAKLHLGGVQNFSDGQQALTNENQLGIVSLGVSNPGVDGSCVALDGFSNQVDGLGIIDSLSCDLLAYHGGNAGGCPGAGDFPAFGLLTAANKHGSDHNNDENQRQNTLHNDLLLLIKISVIVP